MSYPYPYPYPHPLPCLCLNLSIHGSTCMHACMHTLARAHTHTHTHTQSCVKPCSVAGPAAIPYLCICIVQVLSQRQRLIAAGGLVRDTGGGERASTSGGAAVAGQLGDTSQPSSVAACFIPLEGSSSLKGREGGLGGNGEAEDLDLGGGGESLEDVLRRKTKAFNISTRERPSDVENWYSVYESESERQ